MPLTRKVILYVFMALLAGSCIEPYFPKDLEYEPVLFVQAIISDNSAFPASVILSNSYPLSQEEPIESPPYVNIYGAMIYVEKDDGTRYYFEATGSIWGFNRGVTYKLIDAPPLLTPGSGYKLVIVTSEQHRIESDYEIYNEATVIEEIGFRHSTEEIPGKGRIEQGYRFNISTSAEGSEPAYFRWSLDYTYRYYVPFQATHFWNGYEKIVASSSAFTYCYKDGIIDRFYVGSTAGMTGNKIKEAPLHFVSQYGDQLQIRYSLHAYQYRISQSAFSFWNNLQALLYNTGGLYETQPFKLTGNIHCVSDPEVNVAGVFEVAAISEKRVFVPRPTEFMIIDHNCTRDTVKNINTLPGGSWITDEGDDFIFSGKAECFDCRLRGGYTTRPPFWDQ